MPETFVGGGPVANNYAASLQPGDLIFRQMLRGATFTPFPLPSGFTLIQSVSQFQAEWLICYRIWQSGDPTTFTQASGSSQDSLIIYRDVNAVSPIASFSTTVHGDWFATNPFLGVTGTTTFGRTTLHNGVIVDSAFNESLSTFTFNPPAGETLRFGQVNAGSGMALADTAASWVLNIPALGADVFYITGGPSSAGASHISKYRISDGVLLARNTSGAIDGTGGAVDPRTGDPWWTNFNQNTVLRSSVNSLATLTTVLTSTGNTVESLVFRGDYIYVGSADGNRSIRKYTRTGTLVASYPVIVNRGTDWISLHPDNKTMYYTSEYGIIYRYNIETQQQLSSFAFPGGTLYTVIVRQSDRHVIVGGNNRIYHLDQNANILAAYDPVPTPFVFAVCLDITEKYLMVGDYSSNAVWKINLATGAGASTPFIYQPGGSSFKTGGIFSLGGTVTLGWVVGSVAFRS